MPKLKPYDPLAAVRKNPAKVTRFELNPAALYNKGLDCPPLQSFPRELFACKNLTSLELFRGIAPSGDPTIPDEIGMFAKLEMLSLGGLRMTTLPATIGKLSRLETLDLVYCDMLRTLPDSIGELKNLEELLLGQTALRALPRTVGKLKKLRRLTLAGVTEVPAELFDVTTLEELHLPATVRTLPKGLSRLTRLRTLGLSADALASAASELPALRHLESLQVEGRATHLPEAIASLGALRALHVGYLGLTSLPPLDGLKELIELDVGGNALPTLSQAVSRLPKLKKLDFSGNPLPLAEKRLVDAMMRATPAKRAAMVGVVAKPPAAAPTVVTRLGIVSSVNASLTMLVADVGVAAKYRGTTNGKKGSPQESDWDHLHTAVGGAFGRLSIAGKQAWAISLEMDCGLVSVWDRAGTLVLCEASFESSEEDLDDDDRRLFHEYLGSPPAKAAKKLGRIELLAPELVLMPSTDACPDVARLSKGSKKRAPCGARKSGLYLRLAKKGSYDVVMEREREHPWGSGRRCLLVPA